MNAAKKFLSLNIEGEKVATLRTAAAAASLRKGSSKLFYIFHRFFVVGVFALFVFQVFLFSSFFFLNCLWLYGTIQFLHKYVKVAFNVK